MGMESIREDEQYPFFGDNKIATVYGATTSIVNIGGKTQPTVEKLYLVDTGVGKQTTDRDPELQIYLPNGLDSGG